MWQPVDPKAAYLGDVVLIVDLDVHIARRGEAHLHIPLALGDHPQCGELSLFKDNSEVASAPIAAVPPVEPGARLG